MNATKRLLTQDFRTAQLENVTRPECRRLRWHAFKRQLGDLERRVDPI